MTPQNARDDDQAVGIPPLVGLGVAWLASIAVAVQVEVPGAAALPATAAGLGFALLAGLWRSSVRLRTGLVLAAVAAAAVARTAGVGDPPPPPHVGVSVGREVSLAGWIADEAWVRDGRASYRVRAESLRGLSETEWQAATGLVLVQTAAYPPLEYGTRLVLTGTLEAPPTLGGFDYPAYLARRGIRAIVRRPELAVAGEPAGQPLRRGLLVVKGVARRGLARALPEPEHSLAVGILLGDSRGIAPDIDAAFKTTNTSHVIAISGSNISLLVVALMALLRPRLGRRRAVVAVAIGVGIYTALVGADAAVVRAALMGGVNLLAVLARRPSEAASTLMLSGMAMTAFRPTYIDDLGFQLSFAATAGLILYSERLTAVVAGPLARLGGGGGVAFLKEALFLTVAAQLTTWPLIAVATGQLSLVSLVANALVVPAQPPVMGLSALAALAGALGDVPGRLAGSVAWLPLAYTIRTVELMAAVPHAAVSLPMSPLAAAAYYAALGVATWPGSVARLWRGARGVHRRDPATPPSHHPPPAGQAVRFGHPAVVALALTGCVLTWCAALGRPDGRLHLYVLDVGQGDALLLVTPNGKRLLVDAGPGPVAILQALGRRLAPWDRRLDVVVLTHVDADHVGGMGAVLARYKIGLAIDAGREGRSPAAREYRQELDAASRRHVAVAGDRLILDSAAGVTAEVLWPEVQPGELSENDLSVVLRVDYGEASFILTGDIETDVEMRLVRNPDVLDVDVLKVAHHGSTTSTTEAWLQAVTPKVALISAGRGNSFGHPKPEVLARLEGSVLRRTDRDGTIEVVTDGRRMWVRPAAVQASP